LGCNVAGFVGHTPLRMWVMGPDAWERAATADERQALADALRERLPAGALVLAPGAVTPMPGGAVEQLGEPHPDHLAVREAALALREDGFEVELYADLPHASARGRLAAPDGAEVHDLGDEAFAAKLRAVRRYASQVDALARAFGGRFDDSALLGREARWKP